MAFPFTFWKGGYPPGYQNLAAWYDLSNTSSYITATGVKLLGDLSGNSNVNVLAMNGSVTGNGASSNIAPTAPSGVWSAWAKVLSPAWGTTARTFCSTLNAATTVGFLFRQSTAGVVELVFYTGGVGKSGVSTSAVPFAAFTFGYVGFVYTEATGIVKFYTSTDGLTWTQLGTDVPFAGNYVIGTDANSFFCAGARWDSGTMAEPFDGVVALAKCYNGNFLAGGTLTANFDPLSTSKIVTNGGTFTASITGETWTLRTSGDHGARICGARDQVEMTAARQPTVANQTLSFASAASQHTQSAKFSFPQPNTIFLVGSLTTWASGAYMLDGDTANTMGLTCTTGTPKMSMNAGSNAAENSNLVIGKRSVFMLQFNGASSLFQIDNTPATTGNPGAGTPNGITLGCLASVVNFADMNMNELIAYTGAIDGATIAQVRAYLAAKWSVTL